MKAILISVLALIALLACKVALADRFKGGSFDGYDSSSYIQTDPSLIGARFRGGSFDGYDNAATTNVTIPRLVARTVIKFF